MRYSDFETAFSAPRLNKYLYACKGNRRKALCLYRYNLKMSQQFYGLISVFEITLRNAINRHFAMRFSDTDWIVTQANGGFLNKYRDAVNLEKTKLSRAGHYNSDRLLTALSFGVWSYLFSRNCFRKSGKTLLRIFPNKPHGLNQREVYKDLDDIRMFRNRIAHHEQICFDYGNINLDEARRIAQTIHAYLCYLGYEPHEILHGVETPNKMFEKIEAIVATLPHDG
jgi:hypothetical protein